jgi:predicted aspartyl protease
VVTCLLAGAPSLAAGQERPASVVPFTLGQHREVIVPVMVQGSGPYPFALDTGSSHSAVASGLASRVGAVPVARAAVSTPAGECDCLVVRLAGLSAGSLAVGEVLATALPDAQIDEKGRIAGVLGQDVLAARRYTIDYERRTVTWDDGAPAAGVALSLQRTTYGTFLVDLPQQGGRVRFVPDSGAEILVVFQRGAALPAVPVRYDAGAAGVVTLASAVTARTGRVADLRLGSIRWRNRQVVVLPLDGAPDAHGDGLLPLHAFARVTVDGPGATMTVVPR